MIRWSLLAGCCWVSALTGLAQAPIVIDAHTHHLGFEGEREWRDLDGQTPEGRSLELHFDTHGNPRTATLFVRHRDVKLKWAVLLNGRKLGALDLMEYPQVSTLTLPPGALRDGDNTLSILSPEAPDDIFIDEVKLVRGQSRRRCTKRRCRCA